MIWWVRAALTCPRAAIEDPPLKSASPPIAPQKPDGEALDDSDGALVQECNDAPQAALASTSEKVNRRNPGVWSEGRKACDE